MARYEAGETLASIARTYDCSPPAISYIVSRSRDRQPEAEASAAAAEPQLVKIHAGEPVAAAAPAPELVLVQGEPSALAPPPFAERNAGLAATLARGLSQRPNGAASAAPQASASQANGHGANGDNRRTLHLSLGGNGTNGSGSNGAANGSQSHGPANGNGAGAHPANGFRPGERPYQPMQAQPERPQADRIEQPRPAPIPQGRYGFPQPGGERVVAESSRADGDGRRNKDPGTFIDQELRNRVDGDIAAFLAAFDAALAGDTLESRAGLREATDRLLRAGARTRIELERLEARVPLGARDGEGRSEPSWRHR